MPTQSHTPGQARAAARLTNAQNFVDAAFAALQEGDVWAMQEEVKRAQHELYIAREESKDGR